jgi:hypothetical protein
VLLEALSVNERAVELVLDVTWLQDAPPLVERWIAYPVIEVPPFAGAVHETVTLRSEAETPGAAGVDGLQNVEFEAGVD